MHMILHHGGVSKVAGMVICRSVSGKGQNEKVIATRPQHMISNPTTRTVVRKRGEAFRMGIVAPKLGRYQGLFGSYHHIGISRESQGGRLARIFMIRMVVSKT